VLSTLNTARFTVTVDSFVKTGKGSSVLETLLVRLFHGLSKKNGHSSFPQMLCKHHMKSIFGNIMLRIQGMGYTISRKANTIIK
jgi:hypothetical protein